MTELYDPGPQWKIGTPDNFGLLDYSEAELWSQYTYWYARGFSGEAMRRFREIERRQIKA